MLEPAVRPLDRAELAAWLTRVTQIIDRSLREGVRAEALALLRAELDGATASVAILAQLALLDDCLRVVHRAVDTDASALTRVLPVVSIAAPKYFAVLPRYESFGDGATTPDEIGRFLVSHLEDPGAFGHAGTPWRGLALVQLVEHHTRNAAPLRELERMLDRLAGELLGDRAGPLRAELHGQFAPAPINLDPRAIAFCRADGPEVFSSVAHGSQIHERDPFDVESIHAEAREAFHRQVVRATTPEQHQYGHGRTLLVLGDSGSGKTHLMRALRHQVHAQRLGYVGYLQMTSEVGDYARYVLRNLVDSLERPYDPPELPESGLLYLSDGLADGAGLSAEDIEELRSAELAGDELDHLIGGLVDRVLRTDGLHGLEPDLVHALLLLQRRDPALHRRVIRFLRCEPLGTYEQRVLAGLAPRDQPEDPMRTIQQLGQIAYELQLASLVLLVDQVEDVVPDGRSVARLQQAIDVLRGISDAVPSVVVVMACLDDVYTVLRGQLTRSVIDRIERDPEPVRLTSERERDEVEAMVVRRLHQLYAAFDVELDDAEPCYPFTEAQLDQASRLRSRDAIARFHQIHAASVAAGAIVGPDGRPLPPPPPVTPELDRVWNDALAAGGGLPDDDAGVLALVGEALRGAADELGLKLVVEKVGPRRLIVEGRAIAPRMLEVCNAGAQGGHLGHQLDELRSLIAQGMVPVALRNSDFQFHGRSKTARQVTAFLEAGGRTVVIEERQLRAIHAARTVGEAYPTAFGTWRRINRPISHLSFIRNILDLDHVPRILSVTETQPLPQVERPPAPIERE